MRRFAPFACTPPRAEYPPLTGKEPGAAKPLPALRPVAGVVCKNVWSHRAAARTALALPGRCPSAVLSPWALYQPP